MVKTRLEAFSDGVFAIVITLLVLDIRLPEKDIYSNKVLWQQLSHVIPSILTYIFSFLVVGVFWVAHHRIFGFIKNINHFLMWANIFYLMTVAIIPFPASMLAKHPFFPTAIIFYSGILFLCGAQHFLFIRYAYKHPLLAEKTDHRRIASYRNGIRIAAVGPVCYLLAIAVSFIQPVLSFIFIIAALVFYIFIVQLFIKRAQGYTDNSEGVENYSEQKLPDK